MQNIGALWFSSCSFSLSLLLLSFAPLNVLFAVMSSSSGDSGASASVGNCEFRGGHASLIDSSLQAAIIKSLRENPCK